MTTDLVLTRLGPSGSTLEAIAFKPARELDNPRTLEKLEIERRYWELRNVRWGIVTEREIPPVVVKNLTWILDRWELGELDLGESEAARIAEHLYAQITGNPRLALNSLCMHCDDALGRRLGTCLSIVRHALAKKWWSVALTVEINPSRPLTGLEPGPSWRAPRAQKRAA